MIVCLEGVDGSGKTTLSEQLQDVFKCPVIKFDRDETDLLTKYRDLAFNYEHSIVILDRGFITDLVYRMVDNDKTSISLMDMIHLLHYMTIIHCDNEQAFEKSIERGEDNITDKNTSETIRNNYNIVYKILDLSCPSFKIYYYNYLEQNVDDVVRFIQEVLPNAK